MIPLKEREALFYTTLLKNGASQRVLARRQFSDEYFVLLQ